ncbi:MAG: ATP-binding protein [Deltaproteobacteria bacterium]|nr:ATP-binding protein [Deltaproteobacteria bacterium]MBN2672342.1 ATP-binding protein [Deltaproteobacteria bacterium]
MKRAFEQLLSEYLTFFPAVAVVGPRQCGKTTLVRTLDSSWNYYDLERQADFSVISHDPDQFFALHPEQVIVDEAQILPALFSALRVAIDENREYPGRFVITGSSSPELLHAISQSLAGRIGVIELPPFTFREVCTAKSVSLTSLISRRATPEEFESSLQLKSDPQGIHKYWLEGGFPEPWIKNNPRFTEVWRENYFTTYVSRDIGRLFPQLDSLRFQRFVGLLAGLSGQTINYSDVARALDTTPKTIKEYFQIAHGTFLWRNIPAFHRNSVKRLVKHPRGYIRDSGILHHQLRIQTTRDLLRHPVIGHSFEGMVQEELLRSFQSEGTNVDYCYYRTGAGAEVDMVVTGTFGMIPVEIKYSQKINSRHIRGLQNFLEEYKCPYGIVINNDKRVQRISENIIAVPFAAV